MSEAELPQVPLAVGDVVTLAGDPATMMTVVEIGKTVRNVGTGVVTKFDDARCIFRVVSGELRAEWLPIVALVQAQHTVKAQLAKANASIATLISERNDAQRDNANLRQIAKDADARSVRMADDYRELKAKVARLVEGVDHTSTEAMRTAAPAIIGTLKRLIA